MQTYTHKHACIHTYLLEIVDSKTTMTWPCTSFTFERYTHIHAYSMQMPALSSQSLLESHRCCNPLPYCIGWLFLVLRLGHTFFFSSQGCEFEQALEFIESFYLHLIFALFDVTLFVMSSLVLKFIKILVCRLSLPVIFFTTCSNFYLDFIIMLAEMLRNYEKFWRIIENTAVYSVFLSNNSHYNYSFNDTMSKQFNDMS